MARTAWNRNTPEKFWAKVAIGKINECWPWQAYVAPSGYGIVGWHGVTMPAHRLAYQLHHKITLPRTQSSKTAPLVLHHCDNRRCCNPAHLWRGTHWDNRWDCVTKGRDNAARGDRNGSRLYPERLKRGDENVARMHPELFQGSRHHNAFLNERQVRRIRDRLAKGARVSKLARDYGVTMAVIWKIKMRRTWRHI